MTNIELNGTQIQESELFLVQTTSPSNVENKSNILNIDDLHINNMETIYKGVTRFLFIIQAGPVIDHLIDVINSTKKIGFGIIWKAVAKVFPQILIVDDSTGNLRSSLQNLTSPIGTLHRILPNIITSMRQSKDCEASLSNFSGQLYSVTSLLPEIHNQLSRLNTVINGACKAMGGFDSALEKLKSIKGFGPLSTKLQEAFAKGIDYFDKMRSNNEDLVTAIIQTMVWLPEYQNSIRRIMASSILCQATMSKGLFKKELCHKSVTWFDDEAEAVCNKCGRYLCEQHRISSPMPTGSTIRNIWFCLDCIKKIKK